MLSKYWAFIVCKPAINPMSFSAITYAFKVLYYYRYQYNVFVLISTHAPLSARPGCFQKNTCIKAHCSNRIFVSYSDSTNYFYSVLRSFQDYLSLYETCQSVGWAKTGDPRDKPLGTPKKSAHQYRIRHIKT